MSRSRFSASETSARPMMPEDGAQDERPVAPHALVPTQAPADQEGHADEQRRPAVAGQDAQVRADAGQAPGREHERRHRGATMWPNSQAVPKARPAARMISELKLRSGTSSSMRSPTPRTSSRTANQGNESAGRRPARRPRVDTHPGRRRRAVGIVLSRPWRAARSAGRAGGPGGGPCLPGGGGGPTGLGPG